MFVKKKKETSKGMWRELESVSQNIKPLSPKKHSEYKTTTVKTTDTWDTDSKLNAKY